MENQQAPNFTLPDENKEIHTLEQYRGSFVLLYFYPKDDTPGCTKEACSIKEDHEALKNHNLIVIGISKDSSESHKKFISKYELPFTLLSDKEGLVCALYKADGILGTKRISYIINPEGIIIKEYLKVNPEKHAEEVLDYISRI